MGFQGDFELHVPEESPSQHELQTMDLLSVLRTTMDISARVYTHTTNATFRKPNITFQNHGLHFNVKESAVCSL